MLSHGYRHNKPPGLALQASSTADSRLMWGLARSITIAAKSAGAGSNEIHSGTASF